MTPQLSAFLKVISACEGTVGDEGYRALFGWRPGNGKVFTSLADHPRQYFRYVDKAGVEHRTSAAGKYQATVTTWQDFIRACGPHDFSPTSQDAFAAWLIAICGAMADVEAGWLQAAIDKCGGRWASLPSSTVPQPHRSYAFCLAVFQAAGGRVSPSIVRKEDAQIIPPAPPAPEKPMPIAIGLLAQLLPSVLALFSGRAQATIAEKTGGDQQLAAQFMQGLIQKVGDSVGVPVKDDATAIQAVAALQSQVQAQGAQVAQQADIIKKLEADSLDYLHDLTQAMKDVVEVRKAEVQIETDSANAASARNDAGKVRRRIDSKAWWAYAIAAGILAAIALAELYVKQAVDGQIIGALILAFGALGNNIATMVNYGYGSSGSSGAKDVLIGEMARRQSNNGGKQ